MVKRRLHAPLGVVMLLATTVSGCTPGHALLALEVAHAEESDIVTVEVDGFGDTADSAMDNALRTALQEAVGTLVDAQDAVANDQLIQSQVLSHSDGFIERVETLAPAAPDNALGGLWKCRVRASVRRGAIARTLDAIPAVQAQVRGMQLWAQAVSGAQTVEDGRRLLKAFDEERPLHRLLVARIVDAKEQPVAMSGVERTPNYDKGTTTLRFGVQIFEDTSMFYERYAEPLIRVLDKVATVDQPSAVWRSKPGLGRGAYQMYSFARVPNNCVGPWDTYDLGYPGIRSDADVVERDAFAVVPEGRNSDGSNVRLRVYRVDRRAYDAAAIPAGVAYLLSDTSGRGYANVRDIIDIVVNVLDFEHEVITTRRVRPLDFMPGAVGEGQAPAGYGDDVASRVAVYYAPGIGFVYWTAHRDRRPSLSPDHVGVSPEFWGGICPSTVMPFAVELPNDVLKDVAFLEVELVPHEGTP